MPAHYYKSAGDPAPDPEEQVARNEQLRDSWEQITQRLEAGESWEDLPFELQALQWTIPMRREEEPGDAHQ
jgi:hypothetical protein